MADDVITTDDVRTMIDIINEWLADGESRIAHADKELKLRQKLTDLLANEPLIPNHKPTKPEVHTR